MADETTPETASPLPPPPPWAGERALTRLVSAALRVDLPSRPADLEDGAARSEAADEIVIDLDDLDVDPRLLALLRDHFGGDEAAVDRALARYCGRYPSLADYAIQALESEDLPEWLWPYVDVDAIARDWAESGALWCLDDAGDGAQPAGVHVFGASP